MEPASTPVAPLGTLPELGILLYESRHGDRSTLPEHQHPFHEVLLFIDGKGDVLLRGQRYPVEAGSVVLVSAGTPHSLEDLPGRPLRLYVLAFRPEAVQCHPEFSLLLHPLRSGSSVLADSVALAGVMDSVRRILYEQKSRQAGWTIAVRTALCDLLLQSYRVWAASGRQLGGAEESDARMEDLRHYVAEHYYGKLSLAMLARQVHLSSRQVSHLFKRRYGVTVMDYLTRVRVERASAMLTETDKEIVAICFEVGYENLSHFYRVFKAATGMSPKRFREQSRSASAR